MWRWSLAWSLLDILSKVFSTYVEVIPGIHAIENIGNGILHVCGGDPDKAMKAKLLDQYSPRMWRWS